MFEAFTAGAARALNRAETLARKAGASNVEPLHLLVALAVESESLAAQLLSEFGVKKERLWAALDGETAKLLDEDIFNDAEELAFELTGSEELLPRSADLRVAITEATAHARSIDRKRQVGTEHLLAGLLAASHPAADLLRDSGLELDRLTERLSETVEMESAPLPPAEGIPPLVLSEPGGDVDLARMLDASVNRAREGLRVVEDYVRFVLDDSGLTRRLKDIRHRLAEAERGLDPELLLAARDTHNDVGTSIMSVSERVRENPRAVLRANFKRIQEALRSLEEYSKLVDVWVAGRFEVLRYDTYTLEKLTMTAVIAHRDLSSARLMVLVGGLPTLGDLTWVVGEALAGGADVIQYREKELPDREWLRRAREVRILTAQSRAFMIMNDRVDLARLSGCDAVHLGQDDISVRDARRVAGRALHVGISTHNSSQLDAAVLAGASYLGVGPVFPSPTKQFSEPEIAGLLFVSHAAEATNLPWFAIGGIGLENIERVLEAGANRIAVSSAVVRAERPRQAAAELKAKLDAIN
jgi:thiamine-phosphate pyrophosphorylase